MFHAIIMVYLSTLHLFLSFLMIEAMLTTEPTIMPKVDTIFVLVQ